MESIINIYKIGKGPSSSHTMGPFRAAEIFKQKNSQAQSFKVTLYGSLAATGKGHLTDLAIQRGLDTENIEIIWKPDKALPRHPNAIYFEAYSNQKLSGEWTVYSIGGGKIVDDHTELTEEKLYPFTTFQQIVEWCEREGKNIWELVDQYDRPEVWKHLEKVWKVMATAVKEGIKNEGVLPGGLNLRRKASSYYHKSLGYRASLKRRGLVFAYALAVAEENAGGGEVVTCPTCGSCGVLPAVLCLLSEYHKFSNEKIYKALATAGIIANIVKTNASISGAEVGCQGEIGTACAMAAGAAVQLFGGTPQQIEYAAEMGLEHHLGLTCDPIEGLVQIPCIERNAFAAARALDCNLFSVLSDGKHQISFDK
ncbi:MAG: L-serine ammonia-lyase, iron-sulfur-dependent, subunit alpha, partial [Spirochaetes bacterium]|nr:L-serine ammonia-lyase, iron-sulfur-dependent, subunit alpha [Spirochaetota bacterium]